MYRLLMTLLVGMTASGAALAQTQDKAAETFDEIERGFYLGGSVGPFFFLNAPADTGRTRPLAPGQTGALELGLDLGDFLSIGVFVQGTANRAGKDYLGYSSTTSPQSGDFAALIPGAALKLSLLGLKDSQGTPRTFITVRGGAGYVMFSPAQLLPRPDILAFGGIGVEYYTRLRHFSIGLELSGNYLVSTGAIAFAATPNMRYAF